ncbi:DUF3304 domain-containing protein [Collimonas silvisoli]|uniref:DUF3304 domain-containing protein n=1 Tax=Collimonas silvisoli TaxID=2825884 RepID=UPI001B8C2BEA|nr:DUF3304 domain-containing protein [Collimonas silvisoli]
MPEIRQLLIAKNTFTRKKFMRLKHLLILTATLALSACAATAPNTAQVPVKKPSMVVDIALVPVSIACFSHPGVGYIHDFYVKEPFSERMAGGLSCGGLVAGGYMLPLKWQPGMKVKVRWKPNGRDWVEKTTTIKRYDEAGDIFVHFFANDEVRVVSSARYGSQSPRHPILKDVTIAPPEEE